MTDTRRLGLPQIDAAQAQKHITHNEVLLRLDAITHLGVVTRAVAPPATIPADARYLVLAGASGAFAGHVNQIALQQDGVWMFLMPQAGWRCYVQDEGVLLVYDATAWQDIATRIHALDQLAHLGLGTSADAGNPLSVKLNNALFMAKQAGEGGTGDLRFKLNREAGTNVVSQLYQSNWSGRAETGLLGDDAYRIKVSADGSAWTTALAIDPASGNAGFGTAPTGDRVTFGGVARPATDNAYTLGTAAARWSTIYAATGTINTSGSKEKTDVAPIRDGLAFIRALNPVSFRWVVGGVSIAPDSDRDGGLPRTIPRPGKRLHFGLIAEEVKQVSDALGLDLAVYVHDRENDRHGLRYDQLIAPLIAAVQNIAARLEFLEAQTK